VSHLAHLVLIAVAFVFGLFCLVTAALLYPGEEGNIQSKFEDFWVRVDDYQKLALSGHAAFVTQLAKLETRLLDYVFGPRLLSVRAVVVSVCSSLGILFLVAMLIIDPHALQWGLAAIAVISSLLLLSETNFVERRALLSRFLWTVVVILAVPTALLSVVYLSFVGAFVGGASGGLGLALSLVLVAVGGFACDVLFVVSTRRLVRWAGEMTSLIKVLATMAANLLLALFLVSLPAPFLAFDVGRLSDPFFSTTLSIACTNIFDVVLALFFVTLAAMLLIHRAVWPLLTRTLFRLQAVGVQGRRAVLLAIGFGLVGWSGISVPPIIRDIVTALAKT